LEFESGSIYLLTVYDVQVGQGKATLKNMKSKGWLVEKEGLSFLEKWGEIYWQVPPS
jgi:hypothetical protein